MSSNSTSQGIQFLLAAEKRAAEKIQDAKKRKTLRIRQAKEEAKAEIEKYRQEREITIANLEAKNLESKQVFAAKVEYDTVRNLQAMNMQVEQHRDSVINGLLDAVCDIKPEVHRNFRRDVDV